MTRRREIYAFYLVLFEKKLGGRLLEGERLLETIRYVIHPTMYQEMQGKDSCRHVRHPVVKL